MNYSGEVGFIMDISTWLYYGYFYVVNVTSGKIEKELFLDQPKVYNTEFTF